MTTFSALQRAENSSSGASGPGRYWHYAFQCSSASRKFLNETDRCVNDIRWPFSALQRAENSSKIDNLTRLARFGLSVLFSEPKIPQRSNAQRASRRWTLSVLFSEPKIPQRTPATTSPARSPPFQCSSASRKFLKELEKAEAIQRLTLSVLFSEPKIPQRAAFRPRARRRATFSALQRAENSSTQTASARRRSGALSVLFSEPKIPQPDV